MKNRHSIQIKQLLQKKKLSKSRFKPQQRIQYTSPILKQSRQITKTTSTTNSLHQQANIQIQCIQKRYDDLYRSYISILQQSKKRSQQYKRQQQQLSKYQKLSQRDKKQIQRLKSMISFIDKRQNSTQTIQSSLIEVQRNLFNIESEPISPIMYGGEGKSYNSSSNNSKNYTAMNSYSSIENLKDSRYKKTNFIKKSILRYNNSSNSGHLENNNSNAKSGISNVNNEQDISENLVIKPTTYAATQLKSYKHRQKSSLSKKSLTNQYPSSNSQKKQAFRKQFSYEQQEKKKMYNTFSSSFRKKQQNQIENNINSSNGNNGIIGSNGVGKYLPKKYESATKLAESILSGSGGINGISHIRSSLDLRKKRNHTPNSSGLDLMHSSSIKNLMHSSSTKNLMAPSSEVKYSRINSPNSKYKFVPSVQL